MHRKKTGCKNEKAIDGYIDVLKKEAKEGTTAWVKNAKMKAEAKLKKYGIPMHKLYHLNYHSSMARLKTNAKRKLNKALTRVEKVVIMDVRRMLEQQRKWKAKVMNSKTSK